jgi:hypothetical protein
MNVIFCELLLSSYIAMDSALLFSYLNLVSEPKIEPIFNSGEPAVKLLSKNKALIVGFL